MIKEYYNNAYLKSLEAEIVDIKDNALVLDKTISYPQGGGQDSDKGKINGIEYYDTKLVDDQILHYMDTTGFAIGQKVLLEIDWNNRYTLMQKHSSQHLLSGLLYNEFNIGTVAIHLGQEYITIETDAEQISEDILYKLEALAIDKINENIEIIAYKVDEPIPLRRSIKKIVDYIRIVEIKGVDKIACGGLHVARLGEIKELSYLSSENIRGHVRFSFVIGDQARSLRIKRAQIVSTLVTKTSSSVDNIIPAFDKLSLENKTLKADIRAKDSMIAKYVLQEGNKIINSEIALDAYKDKNIEHDIFIYKNDGTFYLKTSQDNFNLLKSKFSIRGGGKAPNFQGTFSLVELQSLLKEISTLL